MISTPLVSVITPVYNREKYLVKCIESILNQTYENFEFIIIDDNSSDLTVNIIKDYLLRDSRIKFLENNKNLGATLSFNRGLDIAKGKYIARMDSDDISFPDRFKKQVDIFESWHDLEVLGTGAVLIDHKENEIGRKQFPSNFKKISNIIKTGVPVFDPSVMMRSSTLKEINGFDNRLAPADDYHLWLTLFKQKKIISNIDDYLIKYRLHDSNLSKVASREQLQKSFLALKIYNSNFSTDEFFNQKNHLDLTSFEELLIKYWDGLNTNKEGSIRIIKEYFSSKEYKLKNNEIKVLILLKGLLKKKSFSFLWYLSKFLFIKFLK
jgi:glycosyltransferase involved in cell wall biosynthesis